MPGAKSWLAVTSRWRYLIVAAITAGLALCLIADDLGVSGLGIVSPVLLIAGALGLIVATLALRHWWLGPAVFFGWLPFEDLVRKLQNNNIQVYVVKDALFAIAIFGAAAELRRDNAWRTALGRARPWVMAMLAWAVLLTVPAFSHDWRQPAIGLRNDFLYLPLIGIGYLVGSRQERLRPVLKSLSWLSVVVLSAGLIQALIGPTFLNPSGDAAGLSNLAQYRGAQYVGGTGLYQPTGTFVDPGRFSQMAQLAVALLVATLLITRRRGRNSTALALAVAAAAVWVSGSRAVLVLSAGLVAVAFLADTGRAGRGRRVVVVGALLAGSVLLVSIALPQTFRKTTTYYGSTLSPRSSQNEWSFRWHSYTGGLFAGVRQGGVIGQGTGSQSLGLQYIYGGADRSIQGLYDTESGYGSIAIEWGIVGLALWVCFTWAWLSRLRSSVRATQGTPWHTPSVVLSTWVFTVLVVQFFAGLQFFQNYVTNAFLWFVSGLVFGLATLAKTTRDGATSNVESVARQMVLQSVQ